MITPIARATTLLAISVFLVSVVLFAIDISMSVPGVWHPVASEAAEVIDWASLVAAIAALLLTGLAVLRREPAALRIRTWLGSALIALYYALSYVAFHFVVTTID